MNTQRTLEHLQKTNIVGFPITNTHKEANQMCIIYTSTNFFNQCKTQETKVDNSLKMLCNPIKNLGRTLENYEFL